MVDRKTHATGDFWRARAMALARRLNFHHWLARVVPWLFFLLVVVAAFNLAGREAGVVEQRDLSFRAVRCPGLDLVPGAPSFLRLAASPGAAGNRARPA
jgi:hypothetical protein